MKYGSVCSGVEAATAAWHPLGWEPQWFSEIEAFPSAVLAHHYPEVANLGDMTKFKEWPNDRSIDLLVGGTPCQSFSVAGLRKGLDDPRGNLMLTYLAIAERYRPRWLVWENVPGVLSSNRGRDFGTFLGALGQIGYGFAYRVLDAQYFGVAQRRRRVFVVGYLGDWRRAAAVLFERESLSGHPAPSREKREEAAKCLTRGVGQRYDPETETLPVTGFDAYNNQVTGDVAKTVDTGQDYHHVPIAFGAQNSASQGDGVSSEVVATLDKSKTPAVAFPINTQIGLRGADTSNSSREGLGIGNAGDPAFTLQAHHSHGVAVAFDMRGRDGGAMMEGPHDTANIRAASGGSSRSYVAQALMASGPVGGNQSDDYIQQAVAHTLGTQCSWATEDGTGRGSPLIAATASVRRLTPRECERLQGFPDDYTLIQYRGKDAADGPRYKAMGNSMAVPVMRWIGERIQMVEGMMEGGR